MSVVMNVSEFIKKLEDVANNYKTLYVMGCFGAPLNPKNKTRYTFNHSYNQQENRVKLIKTASNDTFGFDCVNLIKSILWGWNGDTSKTYGGAKYKANGVPDVNADGMIKLCSEVTSDFSKIEVGEALWSKGHIGIYIGEGLAIECTPAWKNKVQVTAVRNLGQRVGYNSRVWTKHGKLPYLNYDVVNKSDTVEIEPAQNKNEALAGTYEVIAPKSLHIRAGAGTDKPSIGILHKGDLVENYGFYNLTGKSSRWLYVKTHNGLVGFCSSKFLRKC